MRITSRYSQSNQDTKHPIWRIAGLSVLGSIIFFMLVYWDPAIRAWTLSLRTPEVHLLMRGASTAGLGIYEALLALLLLGIGAYRRDPRQVKVGKAGLYAVIAGGLVAQLIKHLVGRPRPRLDVDWTQHLGPSLSNGFDSFPSGHTVTAFALAVVVSKAYPGGRHFYYALAAFIGISRIYLDSHYASDVFAGGVLGVVVGSFLYFRFFPKMVHLV